MTASPQLLEQVTSANTAHYTVLGVLAELSDLRDENHKLRRKVAALEASRLRWRDEAKAWKWGALRCLPRKSA